MKKLKGQGEQEITFTPLIEVTEVPATVGAELMQEAVAQYRGERRQQMVGQVKLLLDRVAMIERIVRKCAKQRELCKAQLAAIDAGEFMISEQTLQIIYTNDELNISWDQTAAW